MFAPSFDKVHTSLLIGDGIVHAEVQANFILGNIPQSEDLVVGESSLEISGQNHRLEVAWGSVLDVGLSLSMADASCL